MLHKTFCSSPWFHLRLTHNGNYEECRCYKDSHEPVNINDTSIMEFYNGARMSTLRKSLLDGDSPKGCNECYYQDQFGKVSGRQKQLLKSGVLSNHFDLSLRSSEHYKYFEYSNNNNGEANYRPTDLQIDLGNTCNSACVMCSPAASSLLLQDYKKLHKINSNIFQNPVATRSWTNDPLMVEKFIAELVNIPDLKYIQFLGGETLYDPAFYTICQRLIDTGLSQNMIVGTTTNGTVYDDRVEKLVANFKQFHLGISIESVTKLNDYIRYPGQIEHIKENILKFLDFRNHSGLYATLRITPNLFTISELHLLFDFMIEHQVTAESCNILTRPDVLRMELLPDDIRQETLDKFDNLISRHGMVHTNNANIRRKDLINTVIANTAIEYRNFVRDYAVPENVDHLRYKLIPFLKGFESLRSNTILDYAPRYKNFLQHYGY